MNSSSVTQIVSAIVNSAEATNGQTEKFGEIDTEDAIFLTTETVRPHKVSIIVWIKQPDRVVPYLVTYIAPNLQAGIEYSQMFQKLAKKLRMKSTLLGIRPADMHEAGSFDFILEDFESWMHLPLAMLPEDFHLTFKPKGTKKRPPTWDRTLRSFISALFARRTENRTIN